MSIFRGMWFKFQNLARHIEAQADNDVTLYAMNGNLYFKVGRGQPRLVAGQTIINNYVWNGSECVPGQPAQSRVYVVKYEDVSSEYHPIMSIPAGWLLQNMIIRSTYGSFGAQLSCGTKSGADDIFQSVAINNIDPTYNPEGITVVPVERLFSLESQTSVYLGQVSDEDNWNGMICDIYLQMIKIK